MTRPRSQLVCLEDTPYYHVMSRCVRRSFLCGVDATTGADYEHRRQWIEERIHILSAIFAIDICSYAVMSNHYHIVLKICPEQLQNLDDKGICQRWMQLFQGPLVMQMFMADKPLNVIQQTTVTETIAVWRTRLANLGWFMKCLNEPIARQANAEDGCTGHFWEARYKSQCLKTERALLACMVYVDLNPVRAKMAKTPENSAHTSIKERITPALDLKTAIKQQITEGTLVNLAGDAKPLMPFLNIQPNTTTATLPCTWLEYLDLVDWTGRMARDDKLGAINIATPPILERLKIPAKTWLKDSTLFEQQHPKQFNNEPTSFGIASG